MNVRAILVGAALATLHCANPCESLCDAYFQMELRCDLLACESAAVDPPATCSASAAQGACPRGSDGSVDENGALQASEYAIQQCQADYRRLKPGEGEDASEGAACQALLPDLENLVQEYDDTSDTCTQLQLCERFELLKSTNGIGERPVSQKALP